MGSIAWTAWLLNNHWWCGWRISNIRRYPLISSNSSPAIEQSPTVMLVQAFFRDIYEQSTRFNLNASVQTHCGSFFTRIIKPEIQFSTVRFFTIILYLRVLQTEKLASHLILDLITSLCEYCNVLKYCLRDRRGRGASASQGCCVCSMRSFVKF